ncbi:hypothetical protein PRK78_005073 [Emydomyces testavorans]|uniref:Uncharacterized protein n=1 Tax=Emydomyces testavorans TaxID=2070801 RepID=A0AAF0DJT5_9EURO|nr:hypothetical protein PRK78_005073 [Emydomyces testavorans]
MAADKGVRDGEFVKFAGWDVSGNDQAHFPRLKGKVSELKKIVLDKQGHPFLAFNTNGWIKSWAVLDFDKFQRVSGSNLYVRVEYPGWYFAQGLDSPSNDIERITDVSTPTGVMERVVDKYQGDNKVAAFNTNGWVKGKVTYPLKPAKQSSLFGIYIRLRFLDYNFYPNLDSPGGDIKKTAELGNNVPGLIAVSSGLSNSGGFNTNGWHKHTLQGPPPEKKPDNFSHPYQGIYYRTCWPDFVHLPGLDSPLNDIRQLKGKQLRELLDEARRDPNTIAVNTNGWMKRALVANPQEIPGAENLKGLYVKILTPSSVEATTHAGTTAIPPSLLTTAFFALKGTVIIWCRWILKDANVREAYRKAVATATDDILKRVDSGEYTATAGAEKAHEMRNQYLIGMRDKTSPPGLLVARSIKPAGGSYEYYLDKNAQTKYKKPFRELTQAEAKQVSIDTISSAGRANPNVSAVMRRAGLVSKGVVVIAAAVSVYSVATAQDWETELGKQVLSWSGSISAGQLGVGVGALVGGPVGAILGGIAGSILGGLGADALANWFFGGSSGLQAIELLKSTLEPASKLVETKMSDSGCLYYTHVIRTAHVAVYKSGGHDSQTTAVVQEMVEDVPDPVNLKGAHLGDTHEVLATIVWIQFGNKTLPANAANPKDLVILMDFVRRNLP